MRKLRPWRMRAPDRRQPEAAARRPRATAGLRGPETRTLAATVAFLISVAPACGSRDAGIAEGPPADPGGEASPAGVPSDDPGPGVSRARFETSEGDFVVEVHRDWAPRGAERFLRLVEIGYYDDARFHRVVPGFVVQWGLAGDPALTAEWLDAHIPDDSVRVSNTRGRVAFAFTDSGTRSTQVFINLVDNARLDSAGFAPFGEVAEGMDVVDRLHSGYGERSGGGLRRGDQSRIIAEGNAYLDREFPLLDTLHSATVEGIGVDTVEGG